MTIKIPKPTPALKIPAITLHELAINNMPNRANPFNKFEIFIVVFLKIALKEDQ